MLEIYHNPRCRKSREGLALLEASGKQFKIVNYLDSPPSMDELAGILKKLNMSPLQLVRKNEASWKENYKGKDLSDGEIIEAMVSFPKLIERPIVISEDNAVLGRPPELIEEFIGS